MDKRTCGECTLCCKTHGVLEFLKPAGNWCVHCNVGNGVCTDNKRPHSCKIFECAWLIGDGLPEHRPDKINIVAEFRDISGFGLVVFLWAGSGEALDSPFALRQTRLNLKVGKPVMHVPAVGNPKLYLPRGKRSTDYAFRLGDISQRDIEAVSFLEGRF